MREVIRILLFSNYLVAVALLTSVAVAQISGPAKNGVVWEPPILEWPDELPRATVPNPMIPFLTVAGTRITLDETELVDAQQRLGGTIGSRGDAGESLDWLCLIGADRNGRWVLWLEGSEINGGTVGGFLLQRIGADTKADSRCRILPGGRKSRIKLPVQIRLGMTESDIRKMLGTVTARKGNTLIFHHEHEQLFDARRFTASNTVTVLLDNGSVSAIEVWSTFVD
ncbi:MAG TPA: hypothetical protein VEG32_09420 [Clostridia bacterium]|nr:hypothetical protein [Clostridia bacterium]